MFNKAFLSQLQPEFVYFYGGALVPSKKLDYKKDPVTSENVEVIRPNTHNFENKLRKDLIKELESMSEFPTKHETLILISYGYKGQKEYNKCDLDNKAKTIFDAMKGPIYMDDNQVKILWTFKELLKSSEEDYYSFMIKILNDNTSIKMIDSLKHLYRSI